MNILVTGGAGYIGSHACKLLAQSGHKVTVYDNLSTGHREFARYGDFVHGDIRDTEALRRALKSARAEGVMHFAAKIEVGESVADPGKYFSNNIAGTLSLLEAMRDENVGAIVVSGTCAVYGKPMSVPITEAEPVKPINPYGVTKMAMEEMLRAFARAHGLNWMSLRYFNAAGADADGEIGEWHDPESHLIPRVIRAAMGRLPRLEVYGANYDTPDGTCIRDYIHVEDLAEAHLLALGHLSNGGVSMPLNLGTGQGASVMEIIRGVEEIGGRPVPLAIRDKRPGDPPRLIADATLAKNTLNWMPKRNLRQILASAWEYESAKKGSR